MAAWLYLATYLTILDFYFIFFKSVQENDAIRNRLTNG